jgi:hypothetical protein
MKIDKNRRRTIFSRDDGTLIAVVTRSWPRWQVRISTPPLAPRYFIRRDAAERHAVNFATKAAARARGYSVGRTADGRFAFKRPDGALHNVPQITESGAWFAAYADSTLPPHPTAG